MTMQQTEIIAKAQEVIKRLKAVHGGWRDLSKAAPFVKDAVAEVVQGVREYPSGDRRAIEVEAICALTPTPWWMPMFIKRWLAGKALGELDKLRARMKA